jgi:hypothetical protein
VVFNPGDPHIHEYANNLQGLTDAKHTPEEICKILDANIDAILGDGAARTICRYDGPEHKILWAIMDKVKEGVADYDARAKEAEIQAKGQAVIEARKTTERFTAPPNK